MITENKIREAFEESLAEWDAKADRARAVDVDTAFYFFCQGAAYGVKANGELLREIEGVAA